MLTALMLGLAATNPLAPLRAQDERLARVGYRLASAGAALCRADGHPAGFVVERISQYAPSVRAAAAAAGLGPLPTVTVVVAGSPAAAAGLRVGDQIVAIDGTPVAPEDPAAAPIGYASTGRVRVAIDDALADGRVLLDVTSGADHRAVVIAPPPGCHAQFEVRPSGKLGGSSDGTIVQITSGVLDATATDAELASVVAHELSHNILRHPQTLKAIGRPRRAVRASEAAAERLSVYLLDAAGYSFDEAVAARERIGRRTSWGVLADGTHPGWKETLALMRSEHSRILSLRAASQPVLPPTDLAPPPAG